MIRQKKYLPYLVAAMCCMVWSACTQDRQPCLTPKIASLNFKSIRRASVNDATTVDTPMPAPVLIPLDAATPQARLYSKQSAFVISLSSIADTCRWSLAADSAAGSPADTLTFYYDRKLQFISNACGYAYFYDLRTVNTTHHIVDSVHITNNSVTNNVNTSHMQVYIHAQL